MERKKREGRDGQAEWNEREERGKEERATNQLTGGLQRLFHLETELIEVVPRHEFTLWQPFD